MKEIFLGVAAAAAFLAVWLIGGNLLISALSSAACLGIVMLTIKALEKEKQVKVDLRGDEDAYDKVHQGIMDHSSALARYLEQLQRLNVEKDVLVRLSTIHKTCLKIGEALAEDPSLHMKLNDFSLYYLPGLLNILNTYENLAEGSFKTEEAQKFAGQVSLFLPQIADAFDQKYYSLFSKDVLDSKAEMAAMTAVFKSEGLMDNQDFRGGGS
ncbi:5-bromo-4-chloroindolyl phosphate hydrolysis family protein [Desulfitobacterium chlororespirans]|uniref:5-bromo-4-chloroindolyl phosphate hydrolysis protein n=1 Tax=Desulfitobacterium chlororespirans DSM 11544 TaxID=1121395 RepID=A0A1M7TAL9_9FIRM|nr:5-bromo-4-chloroindolyl phosphate hydrolysis family protein [Desulfitobacterium chlororespirans]SHN67761.1 5-bromo-4-chloroindolyl phosphate hydrolysis protein [Desulfitobacterium chlororespirans DSM 11544]